METYTDERILNQPIGYWASMTGRSAVTTIRKNLEKHGLTQPQWWAINYLADRPGGATLEEVISYHRGFIDTDDALRPDTLALVDIGLVNYRDGVLTLSDKGATRRTETWATITSVLATIRQGVTDEDYVTTIRSLQRMIANVGDDAWHA